MSDRIRLNDLTSDDLDRLYDQADRYRTAWKSAERDVTAAVRMTQDAQQRAEQAEAAADATYRERAHLVALLAALHPSHIGHTDPAAPEWAVVIVETPAGQMSWHIAERDMNLFTHVQPTNRICRGWDGHTTDEKYARMRDLTEAAPNLLSLDTVAEHQREHIKQLTARITTLEHVAAGNRRHVQLIVPELEKAEARVTELEAENAKLIRWHREDGTALDKARRAVDHLADRYRGAETRAEQAESARDQARAEASEARAVVERLKLLVAASSEEGHAVRMAAQYADRAIENGKRAEQAEAAIERVRALADLIEIGAPWTANHRDTAGRIRAALDQPQQPAPANRAKLREQYGQVLRRWGLLDEVNDPQAAEEFAVTDLLAVTEQQPTA
ncbi:hypothetical protein ABT115_15075 [Streptomyces sp. NPDC001832]|uniref:WDGH domain-containing protein n=1 Tax=Streptomyces sp. NPDC001832 TaxID=3154527 RepID=UPI00332591EF